MPRYKLTVAYDGTAFCGWQKQEPLATGVAGSGVAGSGVAGSLRDPSDDAEPAKPAQPGPSPEKLALAEPAAAREDDARPRIALRTVQGVLERAVREVVRERVVLMGASRTDAGVHARGQVAAFTCSPRDSGDEPLEAGKEAKEEGVPMARGCGWPRDRGVERLVRAVNGRLPEDVLVTGCEEVGPGFNPIGGAVEKAYSYLLHVSPARVGAEGGVGSGLRPLWDRNYVHHVWEGLNVEAMNEAAGLMVGEHDFAAFAASGHGRLTTVRRVFSCGVRELSEPGCDGGSAAVGLASNADSARRIRIDIQGNGFLWNMVRIIAGTLVDVGRGRKRATDIPAILASGNRALAGPTLPPTGLCLEWVRYGGSPES